MDPTERRARAKGPEGPYAGARALVLGASGFIGRWVARSLHSEGAHVALVVRDAASARKIFARYGVSGEVLEADLAKPGAVDDVVEAARPEVTFNLAGYGVDRTEREEREAFRINADLVERLAARLAERGCGGRRAPVLVHAGSALEYGEAADVPEDAAAHPTTLYGRSKLAGTEALADACERLGLRAVTARLFTVYGPGEHEGRLLPSLVAAARSGEPLPLTEGLQERDFTYVEEAAQGMLRLGATPAATGIVNVATGRLTSVRAFAEAAARLLGIPPGRLRFGELPTRSDEMRHPAVPVRRLRALTGWTPALPIEEGIRRTIEVERTIELGRVETAAAGRRTAGSPGNGRGPSVEPGPPTAREGARPTAAERNVHVVRTRCRGCDGQRLEAFLSLGPQPLANAFLASPEEFAGEARYPLDVYLCLDCGLVQLLDVIDPEVLFRDYIYVTGTSSTILRHFRDYAAAVIERLALTPDDLVVEVASNDGTLLRPFMERGIRVLGVEPASNIARIARSAGVETVDVFFSRSAAADLRAGHGPARAVLANNVLAHVDDARDFLAGMAHLVDRDGLVVVEVPHLEKLLERIEYDTIYHEHLCYFSVTALLRMYEGVGLSILEVEEVPVHGGSIRIWAGRREAFPEHGAAALRLAAKERAAGYTRLERYRTFASRVEESRDHLLSFLAELRAAGHTLAAYGAPAKGNTLLNYCEIGPDLIPFTVDRNPLKVGRYTPGAHLPVLPVSTLSERMPDRCVILAWNFAREIAGQQGEYRRKGGRFVVPVPEPLYVEGGRP